jgi:hypothetical protein
MGNTVVAKATKVVTISMETTKEELITRIVAASEVEVATEGDDMVIVTLDAEMADVV